MKRCYLVRHAQTYWNHENRIQGHSDLPLSPAGEQQAQRLAVWFTSYPLQGIFTSALQRSRQTAHAIASHARGVAPVVEPELAEMSLGAWEGLTPEQIDTQFVGAYRQWRRNPSSVNIPDAEPVAVFRGRVRRVVARIVERMGEGEYVVVSHGGVIAALLADWLGADYDAILRRVRLDNAGVTAVEFSTGSPHVLWTNWTAHLHENGSHPHVGDGF